MLTCKFSPPSLEAWTYAVSVHGTCCVAGAVIGTLLYAQKPSSTNVPYRLLGVLLGTGAALSVVVLQSFVEAAAPNDRVRWIGPFLTSTFGFTMFFKSINAGYDQFPKGADACITTWLAWFVAFPEPEFAKGKIRRCNNAFVWQRIRCFAYKVMGLFVLVTVLTPISQRQATQSSEMDYSLHQLQIPQWIQSPNALGFLHIWLIYLYASFCLDFSSLSMVAVSMGKVRPNPGFLNPLLASRHLDETWGTRWNLPVQLLLKRTVYVPSRKAGWGTGASAMMTFFASGLLHEYNFSVHNRLAYEPRKAVVFFLVMGMVMLVERLVWENTVPHTMRQLVDRYIPSLVISTLLALSVSAMFQNLFIQSWLKSGFLGAVGEIVPHMVCT